jgi:UDPglucose 6-dehydrogenase
VVLEYSGVEFDFSGKDKMAKVGIIGLGYVGLTSAVGLAKLGHYVVGYDISQSRVAALREGRSPIFENGLEAQLQESSDAGFLSFTSELSELGESGPEFVFICVATPQDDLGAADLSTVFSVAQEIASIAIPDSVIIVKSTVPVGTCKRIESLLARSDLSVASNPEFLREGSALRDFMEPERIVVGASDPQTTARVIELYAKLQAPSVLTTLESAELTKYAANAFLAMRLSFTNDIAELSATSGARVDDVLMAMGMDSRIGSSFLRPGPGWGGSCFPKDTRALVAMATDYGVELPLVSASISSNSRAFARSADTIKRLAGGDLNGKIIGVWGVAFKAHTDDVRDSPALRIIQLLIDEGATVQAFDPEALIPNSSGLVGSESALAAATGSDVLAVLTEWPEFLIVNPRDVAEVMRAPVVYDGRRMLPDAWRDVFQTFVALGENLT